MSDVAHRVHGLRSFEGLDKLILAIAGLCGIAASLTAKQLEAPLLVPAMISGAFLLAYALATWAIGRVRLDPEAIGDNCYYLGFIFTLASLAWTLYDLSVAPEDMSLVRDIVSGFGVALSSTILGVMLRVFLLQFRPDMVVRDREARITLQQATRSYRTALSQSTAGLKQFTIEAQQRLSEQQEHLRAETSKTLEAQRKTIEEDARRSGAALQEATEAAVKASLAAAERMVAEAADRSEIVARESAERMQALLTRLVADLGDVLGGSTALVAELARTGGEAGQSLAESVRGVQASTRRFHVAMERVAADLEGLGPSVDDSARKAAAAMGEASTLYAGKLGDIARAIDPGGLDRALTAHDGRLAQIGDAFRDSAEGVKAAAVRADAAQARLDQLLESLDRLTVKLDETQARRDADLARVAEGLEAVAKQLAELRRNVEDPPKFADPEAGGGGIGGLLRWRR